VTYSSAIDRAVVLAESDGNSVAEVSTGWTKVREVVHMTAPLSDGLWSKISEIPGLRPWSAQRTPHNRAEIGFTDDTQKVSIAFPVADE